MSESVTINEEDLCFHPGLYRTWRERAIRYIRWTRLDIEGLEKLSTKGAALIAPNHLSWKDILLIAGLIPRPISFVANFRLFDLKACQAMLDEYLFKVNGHPVLQRALYRINTLLSRYLVSRVSASGAIPAKLHSHNFSFTDSIIRALRLNKMVCIFPEGRDSPPGDLGRFKLGIPSVLLEYYSRYRENIPVYPVGIWGTHKPYKPGMRLGFHVGDPLVIEDHLQYKKNRTLISFTRELRKCVEDCMDKIIF